MGWFGKRRSAPDVNEMLREYNDAEAARLARLRDGAVAVDDAPNSLTAGGAAGELAVEDVFTITGRGLVATGRVSAGVLRVGDSVSILRAGQPTAASEITGIEMFRKATDQATAGDLVGVLLRGRIDVARGDVIRTSASA